MQAWKLNDQGEKGGEEGHEIEAGTIKTRGAVLSNPDQ